MNEKDLKETFPIGTILSHDGWPKLARFVVTGYGFKPNNPHSKWGLHASVTGEETKAFTFHQLDRCHIWCIPTPVDPYKDGDWV